MRARVWAMAVLADIVIDCKHPAALARFWADVLHGYQIAPYDDDEIARLAELGIADLDDDPTVLIEAVAGPRLWFQKVPESKTVKNRMHIDVRSSNRPAEVERLLSLGATVLGERTELSLTAMRDPEGNEFCIIE